MRPSPTSRLPASLSLSLGFAASLALAGCSGGGSDSSASPAGGVPTPGTGAAASGAVTADWPAPAWAEITGVTAQAPGNSHVPTGVATPWAYLRNIFSPGGLVDGRDYSLRQWRDPATTWPGAFKFEWSFPAQGPADGAFAWGYPALMYGAGPWGYPWGTSNPPRPTQAGAFNNFSVYVDLAFEGRNGADLLLDVYTLPSPDAFDGRNVNEVSILLSHDGVGPMSWLTTEATATHTFAWPLGDSAIYKQPTSSQIMVMPRADWGRRVITGGWINVKEVLDHLIAIGLVDRNAWVAGFELGVEIQRPNAFNWGPYSGSLRFGGSPTVVWQ